MMQITNDLGLPPIPVSPPDDQVIPGSPPVAMATTSPFPTEFEFELPKGYLDMTGNLHRKGIMRLSRAMDEIVPMRDPRVKSNPAYATVIILARVITRLGALDDVNATVIEGLFACDLSYLQTFYRQINELEDPAQPPSANQSPPAAVPQPHTL